jgi:hypothetical protein
MSSRPRPYRGQLRRVTDTDSEDNTDGEGNGRTGTPPTTSSMPCHPSARSPSHSRIPMSFFVY